jgi:hypothetical protein
MGVPPAGKEDIMGSPSADKHSPAIQTLHPSSADEATEESQPTDMAETARDAGIMLHMIVDSISPDPEEIQRGIYKRQARRASSPRREVHTGLVVLTVVLVFLVFALDLIFLRF